MRPFPFVVGCERSGTTLLRNMLDSHPRLAIPPESYFIVRLHRSRSRYDRDGTIDLGALVEELRTHRWFSTWGIDVDGLEGEVASLPDAIRRIYGAYASKRGKERYGDKTPAYVMHLPLLAGMFPEARFAHLLRDGREVALSLAEMSWGPPTVLDAALHWRERVERGRRDGAALGKDRYREIRYEDLVERPEETLRGLVRFFELPFDGAMLEHHARRTDQAGIHRRSTEPPTTGARDWRTQMDAADLAAVEAGIGDLLTELGYERAVEEPPAEARRRARAALSRRRRRHAWRRLRRTVGRVRR